MNPVVYSALEQAIVDAYNSRNQNQKSSEYWSDNECKAVKNKIKDYYIAEQQNKCCYCRRVLHSNNKADWNGEHVIPRSTHSQFMFEPRNLAVTCRTCNTEKGDKNVLKNPRRKRFPDKREDYIIVHPHFDDYDQHIVWFFPLCAPRRSRKGENTIMMCRLMRFATDYAGLETDIFDDRFRAEVGRLVISHTQLEAEAVLAALNTLNRAGT